MNVHKVKSWPKFFQPLSEGVRTHELRRNDRRYEVGDVLEMHEFFSDTQTYSGRILSMRITSITSASEPCAVSEEALHNEFCILSVKLMRPSTHVTLMPWGDS